MIKGGYILQPRIIQESDIAVAPPHIREIWAYLIREANAQPGKYAGYELKRGQLFRSVEDILDGTKWFVGWRKVTYKEDQIKKALKFLRDTNRIDSEKHSKGVLITITNYDFYQNPKNYDKSFSDSDLKNSEVAPTKAPDEGSRKHHTEDHESTTLEGTKAPHSNAETMSISNHGEGENSAKAPDEGPRKHHTEDHESTTLESTKAPTKAPPIYNKKKEEEKEEKEEKEIFDSDGSDQIGDHGDSITDNLEKYFDQGVIIINTERESRISEFNKKLVAGGL